MRRARGNVAATFNLFQVAKRCSATSSYNAQLAAFFVKAKLSGM
jgi:hypothetical protein